MRLTPDDVACWVLKSTRPPAGIDPGWRPGATRSLTRCVRRSYRLDLLAAGQPCLLWVSGRTAPGVHALGTVTGVADDTVLLEVAPGVQTRYARPAIARVVSQAERPAEPVAEDADVVKE